MCRMIAFSSKRDVRVSRFVGDLKWMAKSGKKSPHPNGWGFFCKDSLGNVFYSRSTRPIFEDEFPDFLASSCIIHARKASPGTSKGLFSVHPFLFVRKDSILALAHNGSVKVSESEKRFLRIGVDTELIINLLIKGDLKDIPERFRGRATSATLLLSDGKRITAMRCCWKECDYYTLFLKEESGLVMVSSEGEGRELENGEVITMEDGRIVDVKLVDCGVSV